MVNSIVYPYMANSVPDVKKMMLREIGVKDVDELYVDIPEKIKLKRELKLPSPKSEYEVRRSITTLMAKNKTYNEMLCFLGAGCWPHYVPAVRDEINARSEFVTAYFSPVQMSPGLHQAIFEYQSMMSELLDMDTVVSSMYDWATVCGEAARMANRITGRNELLVTRTISPDRLSVLRNYSESIMDIKLIDYDLETGQLDINDLKKKISSKTAGVYFENPSYLGFIEAKGEEISDITHEAGALSIVGVDPSSLGILTPPGKYGVDIVIGEGQPLGMHMSYGGGLLGIMAFPADSKFMEETPRRVISITTTEEEGYGFDSTRIERSHYLAREKGTSFTGTTSALWSITAAVYLALMGPKGMHDLGEVIMQKSHFAMKLISEINDIKAPIFNSTHFKEFTVNFDGTGKTVRRVNKELLKQGVLAGKDISSEFPELGKSALYCVTELHSEKDVERLACALETVVK